MFKVTSKGTKTTSVDAGYIYKHTVLQMKQQEELEKVNNQK